MQLNPTESFPIVRVLKDPFDTGVYFVRAVIRDATTDVLLATVALTDKGDRRFSKVWKVPYDNAWSQGRFIVITTQVFTDSGYTVRADNYTEEAETYTVQSRWSPALAGAGSGGIDYREIAKVLAEVLDSKKLPDLVTKLETPIKFPVEDILQGVEKIVSKIPEPIEPKEIDLSSLEKGLEKIVKTIKDIPPQIIPKEVDFSPLVKEIRDLGSEIKKTNEEYMRKVERVIAPILNENINLKEYQRKEKRTNYLNSLYAKYK